MEDFRKQVKDLVVYMIDPIDDDDVIENYTDTIMLVCDEYHDKKLNEEKSLELISEDQYLKLGDKFTLKIGRPKCTIGREYEVNRIVYDKEYTDVEYWFWNDHNKNSVVYHKELL